MLKDVIEAANESMFIEDEQYVLVVDLFILRPELQLQVTTGDSHPSGSDQISQLATVPSGKTQRSCLSGYYSLHNNTRIKSQGCFGILSSLAFQWALKLCNYHQK